MIVWLFNNYLYEYLINSLYQHDFDLALQKYSVKIEY